MLDITSLRVKIDPITGAEFYEGDFGGPIRSGEDILSGIKDENLRLLVPEDYIIFLQTFGFGELDASFYFEEGPVLPELIFGNKLDSMSDILIFASDQSENSYAFNIANGHVV